MKFVLSTILLLCVSAFASLPDEIDYITYYDIYQEKVEIFEDAQDLNNYLLEQISSTQGQIQQRHQDLSRSREDLRRSQQDIVDLEAQSRSLSRQIDRLHQEISHHQNEISNQQNRLRQLAQQISSLSRRIDNERDQLRDLGQVVSQIEREMQANISRINSLKREIGQLERELGQLESQIASLREQRTQATKEVGLNKNLIEKMKEKIKEVEALLAKPDLDPNEERRLRSQLSNFQSKLSQAQRDLQTAQSTLDRVKRELGTKESRRAVVNKELQPKRTRLEQLIADNRPNERRLQEAKTRVQSKEREIDRLSDTRRDLERDRKQTESRVATLRSLIRDKDAQIRSNESSIRRIASDIRTIRQNIDQIRSGIARIEDDIRRLNSELSQLESRQAVAQSEMEQARRVMDHAEDEYEQRANLYNHYKRISQKIGRDQAAPLAIALGGPVGDRLGAVEGRANGLEIGERMGHLDGRLRGLRQGKVDGDRDGYNEGVNSQDAYDEGYKKGLVLGKEKARQEAMNHDYPIAYRARKEELIEVGQKSLSFIELKRFPSRIDDVIERVASDLEYLSSAPGDLSRPEDVWKTPSNYDVDLSNRECRSSAYKGVVDFIRACESSYVSSFHQNYRSAHFAKYEISYVSKYNQVKMPRFNEVKEDKYPEGYKQAYDVVFIEAKERGLADARQRGQLQGIEDGYNQSIESERERARQLGQRAAEEFLHTHPVIRLAKKNTLQLRSSSPYGYIKDGILYVDTSLVNHGSVTSDTRNGVLEVVDFSNNLELLSNRKVSVQPVAGDSLKTQKGVARFKIKNTAAPGDNFKVKLKAVFNDFDTHTGVVTQSKSISGTITANPNLKIKLKHRKKIRARTIFRPKGNKKRIKVILEGQTLDDLPGNGYKVEIVSLDEDKATILTEDKFISILEKGKKKRLKFKFKVNPKLKNDELKFELRIHFNEIVIQKQQLSIKIK